MRKNHKFNKKDLKVYNILLDKLSKTDNLYSIRDLIKSHIKNGYPYSNHSTRNNNNRMLGDCNGDGLVNVLDVVALVNYILGDETNDTIESNCDMNGDGGINVLDVIEVMNLILNTDPHEEWNEDDIIDRVILLQKQGSDDFISFDETQDLDIHDTPFPNGYVLEEANSESVVLITAPHAQNQYRPTRWVESYSPESGLRYCSSSYPPSCHKPVDYCTGGMAKTLAEMTNSSVLYTRGKQGDPNYYDFPGIDYYGRHAQDNLNSGNEADPNMGWYNFLGIQTSDFYDEYMGGNRIPFKQELYEYLSTHPEIKLVIDLHGASSANNHWDLDIGLLGDNGPDGLNLQDCNVNYGCNWSSQVSIGGSSYPTLDLNFLQEIVSTFHEYEIGLCDYNCGSGNSNCQLGGYCPDDVVGHGPISFNDFSAANQYSVTKFVNNNFGQSVQALQIEVTDFYRCSEGRDLRNMASFLNSLSEIIRKANIYYGDARL